MEIDWFEIQDVLHERRLATDRDYHIQQEERMKVPAAEERVTVVYKLRELEAVAKALEIRKARLAQNGAISERALAVTAEALDKTYAGIDLAIHRRKNRDL